MARRLRWEGGRIPIGGPQVEGLMCRESRLEDGSSFAAVHTHGRWMDWVPPFHVPRTLGRLCALELFFGFELGAS